jgi:hypothetical protein
VNEDEYRNAPYKFSPDVEESENMAEAANRGVFPGMQWKVVDGGTTESDQYLELKGEWGGL